MKFSVGYQLCPDDYFLDSIIERKDSISEVYFSWGEIANGRNNQIKRADMTPWEAQSKQLEDLKRLSDSEIKLNLLFNATCYGKDSQSRAFFEKAGDITDYVSTNFSLASITTTSPLIAGFIKSNFERIDVRASVNMGIGTIEGMDYIKDCYDSFYLKRELNRDFDKIRELKSWCDDNGKVLYALANSGCLNNCSAHTFHDNLVSHESEISTMDNGFEFKGICHKYLRKTENMKALFDNTGFIRPEDVYLYEEFFTSLKLATRVNSNPVRILRAYIDNKAYKGSTLELLEPNHTSVIYPYILENSRIEKEVTKSGIKYINIEKALIKLEDNVYVN